MPELPVNMNSTEFLIENSEPIADERRDYLGMSSLGGSCLRALWYSLHWTSPAERLTIRQRRIFERGDIEEKRIIADLREVAGYEVFRLEDGTEIPMTGDVDETQEELIGFAGHIKGHPDGRVRGVVEAPKTDHLLEMKTGKNSKFNECKKKGVKKFSPTYWGQAMMYMGKMALKRTLFVMTNKDTEERYYERIHFDKEEYNELERKGHIIVMSNEPLDKVSHNRNWFECKWCNHREICHDNAMPEKNCRTCAHVDMLDDGKWACGRDDTELSYDAQLAGCVNWKRGWSL